MTFQTKARPLLAALLPLLTITAVPAQAGAADCLFAYTAPLPDMHTAVASASPMHLAAVAAGFAAAALAAAFLPPFPVRKAPASPAAPVQAEAFGPIYCPRTRRWRDASTGRLVKAPS